MGLPLRVMKRHSFHGRISIKKKKKEKINEQGTRVALLILLRGRRPIKNRREVGGKTAAVLPVVQLVIQDHGQCVCFSGTDGGVEHRNVFQYNYH